eukprot:13627_1
MKDASDIKWLKPIIPTSTARPMPSTLLSNYGITEYKTKHGHFKSFKSLKWRQIHPAGEGTLTRAPQHNILENVSLKFGDKWTHATYSNEYITVLNQGYHQVNNTINNS